MSLVTNFFNKIKNGLWPNKKTSLGAKALETSNTEIVLYGTSWCGDTRRARSFLDQHHISYKYIDIDRDPSAAKYVESVNRGYRSVPTILFPDGSMLVEPSTTQLSQKLGL